MILLDGLNEDVRTRTADVDVKTRQPNITHPRDRRGFFVFSP